MKTALNGRRGLRMAVWSQVKVWGRRLSLRPIGCTPALSVRKQRRCSCNCRLCRYIYVLCLHFCFFYLLIYRDRWTDLWPVTLIYPLGSERLLECEGRVPSVQGHSCPVLTPEPFACRMRHCSRTASGKQRWWCGSHHALAAAATHARRSWLSPAGSARLLTHQNTCAH